jgi:hypothetical protein
MKKYYACRRGSQMVEASLIFPLIVVISVMSVAVMIYFYDCTETAAVMSMDVRSLAGEEAGTCSSDDAENRSVISEKNNFEYDISEKSGLLFRKITASSDADYDETRFFNISNEKYFSFSRSCINEAEIIWKKQLIKEIADE